MKIIECEQGSPEWFACKAGIPSAGSLDKIITSKCEPSKQRKDYMHQLAGEAIVGAMESGYTNFAMERGKVLEAEARALYEFQHGVTVRQVGFCIRDDNLLGASPDGLMDQEQGGIEIKCPLIHTHVEYLLGGKLPTKYYQQVQGNLFVTGAKYWVFMSYYPGMRPLVVRVEPDIKFYAALTVELRSFNQELVETIKAIQ